MADISKIKVPNDSTTYNVYDTAAVTSLKTVNSTSLEDSGNISITESRKVWYGTCDTSSSTATKEVVTTTGNFVFTNGNILKIKFTYGNTTSNPKIRVSGSTTDYSIRGASATSSNLWQAGETIEVVYYNSSFYITHNPMQNGSIYPSLSSVKLSDSYNSNNWLSIPTANAMKSVYTMLDGRLADSHPEVDAVLSPNPTYFQLYESGKSIKLLVWNGIADLTGAVKPTRTITGSTTQYNICSIPPDYRPDIGLVEVMQSSNQGQWMCRVHGANDGDDGYVTFSRNRSANSYTDVTTSTWLSFHMMWVVPE